VGALGLGGPLLALVLLSVLASSGRGGGRGENVGLLLISHAGFGWILLALASAVLIGIGNGWRPFGGVSDAEAAEAREHPAQE